MSRVPASGQSSSQLRLLIVVPLEVSKRNPVFLYKHAHRRFWGSLLSQGTLENGNMSASGVHIPISQLVHGLSHAF